MSRASSPKRAKGCPVCGKPADPIHAPFCSQGCRDRDLLAWLGESYRAAGPPADEDGREIDVDGLDIRRDPPL